MKKLCLILCIAALLIWWEAPAAAAALIIASAVIVLKNYDGSVLYKVIIGMEFAGFMLAVWNWDLDVGLCLVEKFTGLVK